jgi:hypothetical protein
MAILTLISLSALISAGLGVLFHAAWVRRQLQLRRRLPKQWPLSPRLVANSEERRVWRWLARAFPEHAVMLKMPVTRFTVPRVHEQGAQWHELLSGVYCTLTVVNTNGHVIGCIDAPGARRIARRNYFLKESLLRQCNIAYLVVDSTNMPSMSDIRYAFLGETASRPASEEDKRDLAAIQAASEALRASLLHQRETRLNPPRSQSGSSLNGHRRQERGSGFANLFQENSFIAPLDSRKAELRPER